MKKVKLKEVWKELDSINIKYNELSYPELLAWIKKSVPAGTKKKILK